MAEPNAALIDALAVFQAEEEGRKAFEAAQTRRALYLRDDLFNLVEMKVQQAAAALRQHPIGIASAFRRSADHSRPGNLVVSAYMGANDTPICTATISLTVDGRFCVTAPGYERVMPYEHSVAPLDIYLGDTDVAGFIDEVIAHVAIVGLRIYRRDRRR